MQRPIALNIAQSETKWHTEIVYYQLDTVDSNVAKAYKCCIHSSRSAHTVTTQYTPDEEKNHPDKKKRNVYYAQRSYYVNVLNLM